MHRRGRTARRNPSLQVLRDSSGYGVYLQNQGTTDPADPTDPSAGNTFQNIAEENVGP